MACFREAVMRDYSNHPGEPDSMFNYAVLKMIDSPSASDLREAIMCFDEYLRKNPGDLYAQMGKGYASVMLANLYLVLKNYFKAAEHSKLGFYLMDEAVEQEPDNLSLRFMRARFDAQAPRKVGRYVVAIKDLKYLLDNKDRLTEGIDQICMFLLAKALFLSGDEEKARRQLGDLRIAYPHDPMSSMSLEQEILISEIELRSMLRSPWSEGN